MNIAKAWAPKADLSNATRVRNDAINIPKTGEAHMRQILGMSVARLG
jgi:hypothetical protein